MADGGTSVYLYYAAAAAAAGAAITEGQAQAAAALERARVLEEELRQTELAALDEENERLKALRFANEQILVNAGGVDPYASPSLTAARQYNFKVAESDILNLGLSTAAARSGTSVQIKILKRNARAAINSGILQAASTMFMAGAEGSMLKQPPGGNAASASKLKPSKGSKMIPGGKGG